MKAVVEAKSAAKPDIAYAAGIDIQSWPGFIRGIESVEILTEGPPRTGTRFRETRTLFGRKASQEMTVAVLKPPRRCVFTAENHGARYVATTEFLPHGNGSLLRLTFEGIPVTLAARLLSIMSVLMAAQVRRQLQSDIDDLAAEAGRRAALQTNPAAEPHPRALAKG